jgi:hypothetical protein
MSGKYDPAGTDMNRCPAKRVFVMEIVISVSPAR